MTESDMKMFSEKLAWAVDNRKELNDDELLEYLINIVELAIEISKIEGRRELLSKE